MIGKEKKEDWRLAHNVIFCPEEFEIKDMVGWIKQCGLTTVLINCAAQ